MDPARLHILVVDDVVDAADSTVELLSLWGYDARACYCGATALESALGRRPCVVILDVGDAADGRVPVRRLVPRNASLQSGPDHRSQRVLGRGVLRRAVSRESNTTC